MPGLPGRCSPMPAGCCARQNSGYRFRCPSLTPRCAPARARVVCARAARFQFFAPACALAFSANPLRPFSRRRKNRPTPVQKLKRRRRIRRGDDAPLPRKTLRGQLSGRAVVK